MVLQPSRAGFSRLRMLAGAGCAALMIAATPMGAMAQSAVTSFNIRSAPLSQSLLEFGRQAGISLGCAGAPFRATCRFMRLLIACSPVRV